MTPDEARSVLGLAPDATLDDAVARHRRLQRQHHPDVAGATDPDATERSIRLNLALAVLRAAPAVAPPPCDPLVPPAPTDSPRPWRDDGTVEVVIDGDSILVTAPADETWQRLHDAAGSIGGIGHVDPRLGLLEVIVRFEGGPSCSVLLSLQGRAHATEVFCEMESIEARPTPPIGPVLDALVETLVAGGAHPRSNPAD